MDQRRNVQVGGRQTNLQLEAEYWSALDEIGRRETLGLNELCTFIDRRRARSSLAPAVRRFVIRYFRDIAAGPRAAMAVPDQPRA